MQQRPISGSQLCRTAKRRQQRPQTSLGFIRKPDHPQLFTPSPPRLVGFDLREYFRLHGSSAGLRVGVNGRPSGDAALRSYVEDCRLEAIVREAAEKEKEEDDSSLEWERLSQSASPAPLCWQAQVKTEVSVRVPSSPSQTELKTKDTNVKNGEVRRIREKAPHSSRQSVEKTTTATEKFPLTQGRRCQCEELEDEDTTDLRDIAHKYPELGLCIFDIEEEEEDKNTEHHYREERVRSGTRRSRHILRLSVTMPSWDRVEERGRNSVRKIYHSPTTSSSPSHTSAEYMGIVRNSLSRYLNN